MTPFFFFNDTATTEIYTLSLHDALPIYPALPGRLFRLPPVPAAGDAHRHARPTGVRLGRRMAARLRRRRHRGAGGRLGAADRKSTRLNSSHANISYAVFCLKKKKTGVNL